MQRLYQTILHAGDEVEKTKRYQLAETLTADADHVLLLTATPHHGDDDRFAHFIRLLDPDLFPEPHRLADKAGEIRRDILRLGPDCPWALRRLKEDLKDFQGMRLFPDRHAHTITFRLNREEYDLYKAVTAYINEFLPQASGAEKASVALARTVLQRRLASSTMAIFESIRRRLEKQQKLLKELEDLPPAQRASRLAQLQGRMIDAEQDEDDLDEAERDQLADEFTAAIELDQLRAEIAALQDLLCTRPTRPRPGSGLQTHRPAGLPQAGRVQRTHRRPRQAPHLHRAPRHPQSPARAPGEVGLFHLPKFTAA